MPEPRSGRAASAAPTAPAAATAPSAVRASGARALAPPWPLLVSEFVGTAVLVGVGCSVVIADFGAGGVVARLVPDAALRRALTGFLFGTTGALIALSPVGKVSGAHMNPVVTLAFWLRRSLSGRLAAGYAAAQFAGAVVGALALPLWGAFGRSVHDAATVPGPAGDRVALAGEAGATFALIFGLFAVLGHRRLRPFTPALFPPLYAWLVWLEAPLSGTSTNPARTFGPAVVAHLWRGWWVYGLGPVVGSVAAVALLTALSPLTRWEVEVAKVYHFAHDPHGLLHRSPGRKR